MKNKLLLLLCSLLMTGCWNYNELNELAIVNAVGIDFKNGEYRVSMMVSNGESTTNSNKDGETSSTLLVGDGKTITEAIQNIENKTSKIIYMSHLNVIVISDEIAFNSVYPIIDPFFRNPETIKKYQIVIAKDDSASDILKIISPIEAYPSLNIAANIRDAKETIGYSSDVILSDFVFKAINKGIDPIVPSIRIDGSVSNADDGKDLDKSYVSTTLELETMAAFSDFKLVAFSTRDESKGINIINNKINSIIIKTSCQNNDYVVSKIDGIKTKIEINDKIIYNVSASGSINETNCKLNLINPNVIKDINKKTSNELKKIINDAILFSIDNDIDIFGIGFKASRLKKDYNINNYEIKVDLNLKTKGSLENTLKEQKYEKN